MFSFPTENTKNGKDDLWICSSPEAGTYKISAIYGIVNQQIYLYSIEKLLEIVPNSEQY